MDKWKSRGGNSQRRQEKKNEDQRRERVRRKTVREKVAKSRNTAFFEWFVAPEGRKVGSLKRRVRSHLGRWEMNNCTPLCREAHFEVKMYKAHQLRSTFRNWDDEKVHAVVAQGTFRSQRGKKNWRSQTTFGSWVRWWKIARRCGAKHISKSKNTPFSDHFWKLRLLSISISFIYLYLYLHLYPYLYLFIYLSASLRTKLFCETSSIFELNIKNATILRVFLNFWTWQRQKRSYSARLPQFFKLTATSKTKQFCETSFKNGKLSAELTASYQCVLRLFHSICLKRCSCHEKVMPGHTKCCTCRAKLP